jgi:hypothetical protein
VWFLSTGYIFMAWYLVKPKDFTSTCVILGWSSSIEYETF